MDLAEIRRDYSSRTLDLEDLKPEPSAQFAHWFEQAQHADVMEVNAMSIATVDPQGRPTQRTVLLKYFDGDGFVFFTNLGSRKATHIAANASVSLLFFWPELERQIAIEGAASRISIQESMRYFVRRPRGSRIGAWVSRQSSIVNSRQVLEAKFEEMKCKFAEGEVPLPTFWGGIRVQPRRFEFWQGRPNRLHDRFQYSLQDDRGWKIDRLAP